MYIGIGPENGKRVSDREAFGYACERCLKGEPEEQKEFMCIVKSCETIEEIASTVVEWFFSGNWIYDNYDNKKTGWIIRFSDKTLRSFFGTYQEAFESARQEAKEKGLGFEVN